MNYLHYNYILFNADDGSIWKDHPDGYYSICVEDLRDVDGIKVVSAPADHLNHIKRLIFAIHTSPRIAKSIKLPFKELWYRHYFKADFNNSKPYAFLLLNHSLSFSYFQYLKQNYKGCKIVLLHRDLVKVCKRCAPGLMENPNIDLEMTFDKGESQLYGLPHFDEFESLIEIPRLNTYESDVYFAGKAKDRLSILLAIYKRITSFGLNCKFYLTGVPKDEQVCLPGIEYSDSFMTYREMLYHTVNSKCVLEINQGGADGYTSRFLEAVMYNKKLITNNTFIKQSKFYSPESILCFNKLEEIEKDFIIDNRRIDYNYNGEFSPLRMIERVDEELIKKYGEQI